MIMKRVCTCVRPNKDVLGTTKDRISPHGYAVTVALWVLTVLRESEFHLPYLHADIAAVRTPQPGTAVPGLDRGFTTVRAWSLLPSMLTAPLDFFIERLWPQHY